MAEALRSTGIMSAIVPPPMVTGEEPKHPARKRNTISEFIFGLNEHARLKTVKNTFDTL